MFIAYIIHHHTRFNQHQLAQRRDPFNAPKCTPCCGWDPYVWTAHNLESFGSPHGVGPGTTFPGSNCSCSSKRLGRTFHTPHTIPRWWAAVGSMRPACRNGGCWTEMDGLKTGGEINHLCQTFNLCKNLGGKEKTTGEICPTISAEKIQQLLFAPLLNVKLKAVQQTWW